MKLYELTGQYLRLLEEDDMDPDVLRDTLEGLQGEIGDKAEAIAKVMRSIEAEEAALKAEEDRLANRRRSLENKRVSMKGYLETQLQLAGLDKIKGSIFTIALQNNPPSVSIQDDAVIPETYYIPQPAKLDKKALMDDLKAGAQMDGVCLQQTRSLRIR